jgi:hypothetical protein
MASKKSIVTEGKCLGVFTSLSDIYIALAADGDDLLLSIMTCSSSIHQSLIKLSHGVFLQPLPLDFFEVSHNLILILFGYGPWRELICARVDSLNIFTSLLNPLYRSQLGSILW